MNHCAFCCCHFFFCKKRKAWNQKPTYSFQLEFSGSISLYSGITLVHSVLLWFIHYSTITNTCLFKSKVCNQYDRLLRDQSQKMNHLSKQCWTIPYMFINKAFTTCYMYRNVILSLIQCRGKVFQQPLSVLPTKS